MSDDLSPAEAEDIQQEEKLVPVTESIRYRKRAQAAEQQLAELQQQYEQLQQSLDESQKQVTLTERRRQIDQLLVESDAIDLEAARLLTEAAVQQMDEADVALAVRELRQRKPYLFRRSNAHGNSSMSPRPRRNGHRLDDAAESAAATGDRRDLLRYLRMRRSTQA